jgi:hypothetical protein
MSKNSRFTSKAVRLDKRVVGAEANHLLSKLEFHFTTEHGSWLNMDEVEYSVLITECLD